MTVNRSAGLNPTRSPLGLGLLVGAVAVLAGVVLGFGGPIAGAAVALGGLAALPPVEAIYPMREADDAGLPLDGRHRYRVRVGAAGVPCDAFWSLTVYERHPDGRLFFVDNPIDRYALGDRTPGLVRGADGSIDLWLQRDPPTDPAARANWLPAAAGPMTLALRAYLPRPALREGRAALPSVERLG